MPAARHAALFAILAVPMLASSPAEAQSVNGQSIAGDWVRADSNYDPNDLMRIRIAGTDAVLTSVPASALRAFRVGQVLWQGIQSGGAVQIRGSDGQYYAATLSLKGANEIRVDIHRTAPGDDQTWRRPGPALDGDWERIGPGAPDDGMKINVTGTEARIGFLPASAPRNMRVGTRLWQNIAHPNTLDVLAADGRYHVAQVTLLGTDSLRIDSKSPQLGSGLIWVRPRIALAARAGLSGPPATGPGSNLQAPPAPPVFNPPATPPAPPGAPCVATSLKLDGTDISWGWSLSSPTRDDALAETRGIWEYLYAGNPGPTDVPVDLDRSLVPGFPDGFSVLWQSVRGRVPFEEHRDLTASEYDQRDQAARSVGRVPIDIEAYQTSAGTRYAGLWMRPRTVVATRVDHDQTSQEFGQTFRNLRNSGYRLVDVEAYVTPAGTRYAGIWHRSCDNGNWSEWRDMDRAHYQTRFDSLTALGFRVVDFESYLTPSGQRYAAIWQQVTPGRAWAVRTDRNLKSFLNFHNQYVDEGLRLIDYESYDTANGIRHAGVWAENDARHDHPFRAAVDDSIEAYRQRHGIPGISVVAMQDDEVIYQRGFGWADSAARKEAHSGTVYLIASVSKAIAGTIAARLEERGLLDLSDSTRSFLDSLPVDHTHTVEQLLAKIGCISHYREGTEPDTSRLYAFRAPALSQMWGDSATSLLRSPTCTPGSHYRYSTHGFTYVGGVLEEVTGNTISGIIEDEIAGPFSLQTMRPLVTAKWGGFGGIGVPRYDMAQGYRWNPPTSGTPRALDYENTTWKVLGGGIQSDALDLARFGWLTLNGDIVSPNTRDNRLWNPLTGGATSWNSTVSGMVPTALGWIVRGRLPRDASGALRRAAEHDGTARGARSLLRIYRDDGLVIAVLTNQRESPLGPSNRGFNHPIASLVNTIATEVFANPPPP